MKSLKRIDSHLWEIPREGGMRVPGRIFASPELMRNLGEDPCIEQVRNVAHLPGIVGWSLAMPDIHWGYGFPIGGVAATDAGEGVISPGGVGYDINCGVRLLATGIRREGLARRLRETLTELFNSVPTGVGSQGAIPDLSRTDLERFLEGGARRAVELGYGSGRDLEFIEEGGRERGAYAGCLSDRARQRGARQMGTLGSGNHFLELGYVEEIYLAEEARLLGLSPDQVVAIIHTGSRGLGYQVCDDHLKQARKAVSRYGIRLPDAQLAAMPLDSSEGRAYLGAMRAAANFAFANRQIISALCEKALCRGLGVDAGELRMRLIYDLSHNIARIESHEVKGKKRNLCVHRKGATRSFGPGSKTLPEAYRAVGQPVLIPGDMGRYSYLCLGSEEAMALSFGSACHGAGRLLSRREAQRRCRGRDPLEELRGMGVRVLARGKRSVAEEVPEAYKDVSAVVRAVSEAGICRPLARFRPLGVIKG